jgi:hypothetical protein
MVALLSFLSKAEGILSAVGEIGEVIKKIARNIENFATYGPAYYALEASKAVKQYFEGSVMAQQLGLSLGSEYSTPFGTTKYWEDIQRAINKTNLQLGIGGQVAKDLRDNLIKGKSALLGYNVDIENFSSAYSTFVEEYGRPFAPSDEDIKNMAMINKAFDGQFDSLIPIAKLYGRTIQDTRTFLNDAMVKSDKYGISVKKVLNDIQKNIADVDRYTFKNGLEGLKKMAIEANRLNLSMDKVVQFSDRFYDAEDAIEMAASLQMMGGEFAQFGDVFQLMYDANNDVGSLIDKVADLTKGMGMLNKTTGEIEFSSLERRQLKYFETISGIPVEEMMRTRRVQKQEEIVRRYISPEFAAGSKENLDEYINKIAMLAEFKGGTPKITIGNEQKLVSQISPQDLEKLSTIGMDPLKDPLENLIMVNRTATEELQKIYQQIVILSNDFEILNAEQLSIAKRAALDKASMESGAGLIRTGQELEKQAKLSAANQSGEVFKKMDEGPSFITKAMSMLGGITTGQLPFPTFSSESKDTTFNKGNIKTTSVSSFKDIKDDENATKELVKSYFNYERYAKNRPNTSEAKLFLSGEAVIKLDMNGKTYKVLDLKNDPNFKNAYKQEFNQEIESSLKSTNDNGGKNTTPSKSLY